MSNSLSLSLASLSMFLSLSLSRFFSLHMNSKQRLEADVVGGKDVMRSVGELHVAANGVGVVQEDGLLVCL